MTNKLTIRRFSSKNFKKFSRISAAYTLQTDESNFVRKRAFLGIYTIIIY